MQEDLHKFCRHKKRSGKNNDVENINGVTKNKNTRMWAIAQPDGRPAEHRWRLLFNAAKFG